MMKAILLAAGEGSRLRPYTENLPKCMVKLAGRPLLDWQIAGLARAGVHAVTVVGGYQVEKIIHPQIRKVINPRWQETNMVASLFCAREEMQDDFLVVYGDIVVEPLVIRAVVECSADLAVAVDRQWYDLWQARFVDPVAEAETLKMNGDFRLREIGRKLQRREDAEAQYIGLFKVAGAARQRFLQAYDELCRTAAEEGRHGQVARMFMTDFLQLLIDRGENITAVPFSGGWIEVDGASDLELYERLYNEGKLGRFVAIGAEW